jgi:CheY-like chemotaxis protein
VSTVSRRILVVDDNCDAARSLATLLRGNRHEVFTAHDGLQAVETAATQRPHAILLDLGLPKLNGYEAARRIRQAPSCDGALLVALTGWGQEEDRRRSHEAGFDAHLTKPVDHAALARLLSAAKGSQA